jgi:hypothetical protein
MQIRARLTTPRSERCLMTAAMLVIAAAAPAAAADFSIGAGAGAASGHVDCVDSFACDHGSSSWKLFAGWRPSDVTEIQVVGFGAGRFKGGDIAPSGTAFGGSFKVDGIGITGGYRWAFAPAWSLIGRAGFASVHTRFVYVDSSLGAVGKTTVQPLAALDLAWQLTPAVGLSLDYDLTRFKAHDTHGTLHLFGLAAQFAF